MRKNNKIIITVIIAVVFAIAACVSIYTVLSPQRTTMYVFNASYRAGTVLTDDMLTPLQADSNIVLAGAKTDADNYFITQKSKDSIVASGDSLKTDVTEGTALMRSMLSVAGGNSIEMSMSPSKIAMTVDVNDVTGITNELSAGSSVNVYITNSSSSTYLLFENMRLLEVFKSEGTGSLSAATLELTNDQALRLLDATANGSVYLGLVNGGGYQYVNKSADGESENNEAVETETEEVVVDEALLPKQEEETAKASSSEKATEQNTGIAAVDVDNEEINN